jgi:microsomal dipeptidase-like Zn-dependent dipeptidase
MPFATKCIDGANHYKRMFDITDDRIRRGYSDADIDLILRGNFRRVRHRSGANHRQVGLGILNSRC